MKKSMNISNLKSDLSVKTMLLKNGTQDFDTPMYIYYIVSAG